MSQGQAVTAPPKPAAPPIGRNSRVPFRLPRPRGRRPRPPGKVPGVAGSSLQWLTPEMACLLLGTHCTLKSPNDNPYETKISANYRIRINYSYKRQQVIYETIPGTNTLKRYPEKINGYTVYYVNFEDQGESLVNSTLTYTINGRITNIRKDFQKHSLSYLYVYYIDYINNNNASRTLIAYVSFKSWPVGSLANNILSSDVNIERVDGQPVFQDGLNVFQTLLN